MMKVKCIRLGNDENHKKNHQFTILNAPFCKQKAKQRKIANILYALRPNETKKNFWIYEQNKFIKQWSKM